MKRKKVIGIICLLTILIAGTAVSQSASLRRPLPTTLSGYVKESGTGIPIEGANVHLTVYDFITGYIDLGYTYTDGQGKYEFSNVPIGAIQVEIYASGYHSYDGVFQQTIYLETYSYDYIFYGYVLHSVTDQALSNAEVKITCGTKVITYTTDNSGYYCIVFSYSTSGVRAFNIEASKIGYSTHTDTISRNYGYEHRNINLKEIRTWVYIEDFGEEDIYLKFEIKEFELSTQYKLVYDVTIEYYYLDPVYSIQVQRYCPIGNLWYHNWISNDNVTHDELPNGLNYLSTHVVEEFYYDKAIYKSRFCSLMGGLVVKASDMFPYYGMELAFQIDNPYYGTTFDWEDNWFGSYPYGFFGTIDEGHPYLTVSYPLSAWYNRA